MSDVQHRAASDPAAALAYRRPQAAARNASRTGPRPVGTQEYLVRHALESCLERLNRTPHGDDFVLKGGVLLAAYGIRRPTKDVDAAAVSTSLTPTNFRRVVTDIAGIDADDGVVFDLSTLAVEEIREEAEYAGLRLKVTTYISTAKVPLAWDVSTGDPIVPQARLIQLPDCSALPWRCSATRRR